MNSKLMSYEDLKEKLKALEKEQKRVKKLYRVKKYCPHRSAYQSYCSKVKKEINLVLSAIHHAKEARRLYEYKILYNTAENIL